jgi:hypothetical protein
MSGMKPLACVMLMIAQGILFALSVYWIIDAYTTLYESEWLTGDAFVPLFLALAFLAIMCFFLTRLVMRSTHRLAALWLGPLAAVTLVPLFGLLAPFLQ